MPLFAEGAEVGRIFAVDYGLVRTEAVFHRVLARAMFAGVGLWPSRFLAFFRFALIS